MTDAAADLARRFLALWEDYLAALLADPSAAELLQPWVKIASAAACNAGRRDGGAAGEQDREAGPPADAAPIAGTFGDRDDAVAELSRGLTQLEQRVAAVERSRSPASHARRRNRRVRAR